MWFKSVVQLCIGTAKQCRYECKLLLLELKLSLRGRQQVNGDVELLVLAVELGLGYMEHLSREQQFSLQNLLPHRHSQ